MSDGSIEVSFDNRLGEHLAAERLYYRSTVLWKLDRVVAVLLVAVGAWLVWAVGWRWWAVVFFLLGAVEWFNALSVRPLQIILWFKRNPKFQETYRLTFDDAGVRFRTATIDARLKWDHYSRVLEGDSMWLLVYGARLYSVIPKRAFESAADRGRFGKLVAAKIGHGRASEAGRG